MIISPYTGPRTQPQLNLGAHVFDERQNGAVGLQGLGALRDAESAATSMRIWGWLSTASMAASTYHGYKRTGSVGWALGWGILGAIFPVVTPAIAVAQGFGKKK